MYCVFVILLTSWSSGLEMAFTIIGQAYYDGGEGEIVEPEPGGRIKMNEEEISWFGTYGLKKHFFCSFFTLQILPVSIISIATIPGSFLSGALTGSIGCKWTLRISCAFVLCGHAIILLASQPWHILVARTIQVRRSILILIWWCLIM